MNIAQHTGTNCNICSSDNNKELLKWDKYTIFRCNKCGLLFTYPLPTPNTLTNYYQGFMFKKPEDWEIQKSTKKRIRELKSLFNMIDWDSSQSSKNFLDYGGGTGVIYNALCKLGFNAYYHDLDKKAQSFTMNAFGLTEKSIVTDILKSNNMFDYIFSDNVIEHVLEPKKFIEDLLQKLNSNGTLIIKTPNARNIETLFNPVVSIQGCFINSLKYNSLTKAIKGFFMRYWHCSPPRHIYSFSKKSLLHLSSDFETYGITSSISYYHTSIFYNTITHQIFTKNKRHKGYKAVLIKFAALPFIPFETILQLLKHALLALRLISPAGIVLKITKI